MSGLKKLKLMQKASYYHNRLKVNYVDRQLFIPDNSQSIRVMGNSRGWDNPARINNRIREMCGQLNHNAHHNTREGDNGRK